MTKPPEHRRLKRCWNCRQEVDLKTIFCPRCGAYKPGAEWSHFWARRLMQYMGDCQTCGQQIFRKDRKKCPTCGRPYPTVPEFKLDVDVRPLMASVVFVGLLVLALYLLFD